MAKILVVDDEKTIAETLATLLKSQGHEVDIAYDGQSAWDKIQKQPFDLLVLDVAMPKLSGYALTKQIRASKKFSSIPIIMISGISRNSGKPDEFWRQGMNVDAYITKPIDPDILIKYVNYILAKKQMAPATALIQEDEKKEAISVSPVFSNEVEIKESKKEAEVISFSAKPTTVLKAEITPEQVVKTFIEAWNRKLFADEYQCLSSKLANIPLEEYIARRISFYEEISASGSLKQELRKVLSVEISDDKSRATVVVLRADIQNQREKIYQQTFYLVKEENKWKIDRVISNY